MEFKTINGNGNVIIYYPNSYKWLRFKEDDFNVLIDNYSQSEIEEYYNIKSRSYTDEDARLNSVYLSVTNKCNLNCEFCASNKAENNMGGQNMHDVELTIQELQEFVIPFLNEVTFKKIIITGGEPLCNKDLLLICEALYKNFGRERLFLETNGLLINTYVASEISKWVQKVEISIENIIEDTSLVAHIKEISKIMNEAGTQLFFSYVVTMKNVSNLRNALNFCDSNNACLNFRFVQPFDDQMDDLLLRKKDIKSVYHTLIDYLLDMRNKELTNYGLELIINNIVPKSRCNAFGKTIAILADGRITMCINLLNKRFQLGEIRDYRGIRENRCRILNNCEIMNQFDTKTQPKCNECKYIDFCGGLCIASREFSSLYNLNDCLLRKVIIEYNLFHHKASNSMEDNIDSFSSLLNKYF